MRRLALIAATAAALLAGCGDGDGGDDLAGSLSYLPADTGFGLVLSTDLDSDQWPALERQLFAGPLAPPPREELERDLSSTDPIPPDPPTDLDSFLDQEVFTEAEVSYREDVRPLLGGELAVGVLGEELTDGGEGLVAALDTGDGELAAELLGQLGLVEIGEQHGRTLYGEGERPFAAIDGDRLIYADGPRGADDENPALEAAIERADEDGGLTIEALDDAHEGLPPDALLRIYSDLGTLLGPELDQARDVPWIDALEPAGVTVSLPDTSTLALDLNLNTDPSGLAEEDLPLPLDVPAPELVRLPGEIAGASADQSRTTTFLLELVRTAFPDSRFVRDVATLERELDLDFERDVLEAFDGPSASSLTPEGDFAARSEVRDPQRLVRLMRRLAPDLGRLVQDLQALRTQGLIALFLVAPDAPIAPRVLGESRIEVSALQGEGELYEITNLVPPRRPLDAPVPDRLVFGIIDDVFVVASDERRAAEIATAPAEPSGIDDAASVASADLGPHRGRLEELLDFDPGPLGELTAFARIDTSRLHAGATVELEP